MSYGIIIYKLQYTCESSKLPTKNEAHFLNNHIFLKNNILFFNHKLSYRESSSSTVQLRHMKCCYDFIV